MTTAKQVAEKAIQDSAAAMAQALGQADLLTHVALFMARRLAGGATIYICGNGGSASQAQHFAAEFVSRFLMERPGLPAVALTTDTSILTAVGNDYGFEEVFARQVHALMKPGDLLWALSTSGRSPNVLKALAAAEKIGGHRLFMCGPQIPDNAPADMFIPARGSGTPRIQELHLLFGHILCQLVDHYLFETPGALREEAPEGLE